MRYLAGIDMIRADRDGFTKILLAAIILLTSSCVPLVGQLVVTGWTSVAAQRWIRGDRDELPRLEIDVDYLIALLGAGFRAFVVQIVLGLASLPFVLAAMACMMVPSFTAGPDADPTLLIGAIVVSFILLFIVMIPFGMFALCALIRTQIADDIGVGLQFGAAARMMQRMAKEIFIGMLVVGFANFGLALVGMLLCGLGVLFVAPVSMLLPTILMAQIYEIYAETTGESVDVAHIPGGDPVGSYRGPEPAGF